MIYDKLVIDTANELKINPKYVRGLSVVYDNFCRFAGMSMQDIDNLILETEEGLREIPPILKGELKEIIRQHGHIEKIYNPLYKPKDFLNFCKDFVSSRKSIFDYWLAGILAWR